MTQRPLLVLALLSLSACSSTNEDPVTSTDAGTDTHQQPPAETAPSCLDLTCTTYVCKCGNGMSVDSSRCSDGACLDGAAVCTPLCADKGGVTSAKPKAPAADAGPTDSSGPRCVGGGDPCGDCAAAKCCSELVACGSDSACVNTTICLGGCKDGFAACVEKCDPGKTMLFRSYTACLEANSCGPCSGVF